MLLRGRLDAIEEAGVASMALEEEPAVPGKGGIAGLKVVFFLPLLPWPDIIKVLWFTSFSVFFFFLFNSYSHGSLRLMA